MLSPRPSRLEAPAFPRLVAALPWLVAALLAAACSPASEPSGPAGAQGVTVDVLPKTANVPPRGTAPFRATVTGSAVTTVTWSVVESGGGTVDGSGLYTAPGTTGTYTVLATSVADPTKTGTASVTVTSAPVIAVAVTPKSAQVSPGGTVRFTAAVTGTTDTAVVWSVQEGTAGGTITTAGDYTAPQAPATYHVVATSHADGTTKDTATVTVAAGAGTTVAATTTLNAHWTLAGSPYHVAGNLVVPKGSILTVDPGVTVIFQGPYYLLIRGRIMSQGSPDAKITWTSADTTQGWWGIRVGEDPATLTDYQSAQRFDYNSLWYGNKGSSHWGYWSGLSGESLQDQYQNRAGGCLWWANASYDYSFTNNDFHYCKAYTAGGGSVFFSTLDVLSYRPWESLDNTYDHCAEQGGSGSDGGGGGTWWHTKDCKASAGALPCGPPSYIAGGSFTNDSDASGSGGGIYSWDAVINLYGDVSFAGNTPNDHSPNDAQTTWNTLTPPAAPVVTSFTASPSPIPPGSSTTLSWDVSGAANIAIDQRVGVVTTAPMWSIPTTGSVNVSPAATTTYTLYASGIGGTTTASVTVTVQ